MGSYFYIPTHNGSTDVVTNSVGEVVARFAYDPDTGRFLQPDPVHTAQPGQDNWDRYAYVWNNPVNFTDSTGMSPDFGNPSARDANIVGLFSILNQAGVGTEALLWGIMGANYFSGTNPALLAPGHVYSGSGNNDRYAEYNKLRNELSVLTLIAAMQATANTTGSFSQEEATQAAFAMLVLLPALSPEPRSAFDEAAVSHDRLVPGSNGAFKDGRFDREHRRASEAWLKKTWGDVFSGAWVSKNWDYAYEESAWAERRWGRTGRQIVAGLKFMWKMSVDLVVLRFGTLMFSLDWAVRGLREWGRHGRSKNIWKPDEWKI